MKLKRDSTRVAMQTRGNANDEYARAPCLRDDAVKHCEIVGNRDTDTHTHMSHSVDVVLSGMNPMTSSRNCTLQQSSVNCRDQCLHRECHCKMYR